MHLPDTLSCACLPGETAELAHIETENTYAPVAKDDFRNALNTYKP